LKRKGKKDFLFIFFLNKKMREGKKEKKGGNRRG